MESFLKRYDIKSPFEVVRNKINNERSKRDKIVEKNKKEIGIA